MKTLSLLFLLFALFLTNNSFCQYKEKENYLAFSAGFDLRNATIGSQATINTPALDFLGKFSIVSSNIEINVGYESFNKICFSKYTVGLGYHFPLYGRIGNTVIKTVFIPSIEPTIINRWGTQWETESSHLSIGVNAGFRWQLSDNFSTEITFNALPRTDLYARYPEIHDNIPIIGSTYLMLIYRFNNNNQR